MRKILSISLMLSMAISLMACSTEPVSNVSGELSEGVGVSNVDTSNLSIFGMDREDLTVEQLDTYNGLIDILWVSSFMKEEGMEDTVDYFGTTLDFQENGIVVVVEDGVTKNGTWTAEWGTILHSGEEVERAKIDVSFDDNTYRMLLDPNDYENVPFFSDNLEMWFDYSGDVEVPRGANETDLKDDEFVPENEYHGTIWRTEKVVPSNPEGNTTTIGIEEIEFLSASEALAGVANHVLYGMNDEYIDAGSGHRFVYTIEEDGVLFDNGVITFKALLEGDYLVFDDGINISYYKNQTEQVKDDTKFFDESFHKLTWYGTSSENNPFYNSILDFSEDGTVKWTTDNDTSTGTWVRTHFDIGIYEMEFDGEIYEVYQMGAANNPRYPGTLVIDDTNYLNFERTLCKLSETVWEISALEDKNGNRTDSPAPLTFEFTSETGGKFTQPEKIDNVALDKEIGGTLLNVDSLSGLAESFVLTGEFFERYNNDGSDKAEVTITENEMIISTDVQNFVFDYSGVRATTVLQDMSVVLDEVYNEKINVLYGDGTTGLKRFDVEENKLKLFLGADGTAELSNGVETLTGTWDYDDVLIGPDGGYINISSDIFDIESNPEFFADLLAELKNQDDQIEWAVDSSLDAYPGNITSEEMWFALGETRFSFVRDDDFYHIAYIDNSFN